MRLTSSFPFLGLSAVLLTTGLGQTGCNGCEPEIGEIAPQIAVDVCKTPERIVRDVNVGGVQDCEIDFGQRDISVQSTYEVKITNVTGIPLDIVSVETPAGLTDPAFKVLSFPEEVGAGLTSTMLVGFRPSVESDVEGIIKIDSDAANVEKGIVVIHLAGTGVDNGLPEIVVTSPDCGTGADPNLGIDFGRVAKDGVAQCTLIIENRGTKPLVLDEVSFDLDSATFVRPADSEPTREPFTFVGRPPQPDDQILPDESATLTISFAPDALGDFEQILQIKSNDPNRPSFGTQLQGQGVTPPTCGPLAILTVNGQPADDDTTIEPLDDVVLSAEASSPSSTDGSIVNVEWSIVSGPDGSQAQLSTPDQLTTGFQFADGRPGVDLAGRYRIMATVVDDLETRSVNPCIIEFEAIPTDTFLAQLTWDTPTGDMDLHVAKRNDSGEFCVSGDRGVDVGPQARSCTPDLDCNFSTCKATFGNRPDWDGDGVESAGDPSLDIDDISGYGPENINVDQSVAGDYLITAFYYSGSVNVGNTLRIYVYGLLQQESFDTLEDDAWWEVAILHWQNLPDGHPRTADGWCLEDLTDTDATDDCGF